MSFKLWSRHPVKRYEGKHFVMRDSEGVWCVCWQESTDAPYIGGEVHVVAEFEDEIAADEECLKLNKK